MRVKNLNTYLPFMLAIHTRKPISKIVNQTQDILISTTHTILTKNFRKHISGIMTSQQNGCGIKK